MRYWKLLYTDEQIKEFKNTLVNEIIKLTDEETRTLAICTTNVHTNIENNLKNIVVAILDS